MKTIKHAFLVDDDAVINMINTRVIKIGKLARKVSAATDAKEALTQLEALWLSSPEEFPEIIFLDINMPDMDGWEFLSEFNNFPVEALAKCKVVMLTSSIDLFDIKKARTYKIVQDYIIKPLQLRMLDTLGSPKHAPFSISQLQVKEI
jgi:CheY-like chemotaxis protein